MVRWSSFWQLFQSRVREFTREPEVLFWVYGFPLLLAIGLGAAFTRREAPPLPIDVMAKYTNAPEAETLAQALKDDGIKAEVHDAEECLQRYRSGKSALYVEPNLDGVRYTYDPARDESVLARYRAEVVVQRLKTDTRPTSSQEDKRAGAPLEVIQKWSTSKSNWQTTDALLSEPGNRYIDFLIPGLMGMNLMGGGLWGVGFVIVDMRVRKLLKRFLASPMKRSDFMLAILASRLVFMIPDMLILLLVGHYGFGVPIRGSLVLVALVVLIGAAAFSGIGLLVASRASKTETVSGLMNLVMLPMWLLSGVFFSSKRFPEFMQPFIQALPLTQINDALREVMLEGGASLQSIAWRLAILACWTIVTFVLAVRWFRWN